ncbi:unnamed protein product [Bursaphelenchus okinawaensis]|uniref:Uncharacterized protein n=1 Tax=Bursaphelenchus okinawaensis TaxID=465554 RepID=A0A811LC77_9BILA|nr:unnamed protein product [Bursaphelenchus okinawaensis]CAG9120469.1 unnamed protein product [Bursaphelenchus okinawaensis]
MYNNSVSLPVSDYRQNVLILKDYEDLKNYRTLSRRRELEEILRSQMAPIEAESEVIRMEIKPHVPHTKIAVFVMHNSLNYQFSWPSEPSSDTES